MTRPRYPLSRRLSLAEHLHGHLVNDPYRWLEDRASEETRIWLAGQKELFADTAATWPGRARFAARIRELLGAGYVSPPAWRAERQFFMRRSATQEHSVLYVTESGGTRDRVLIDPMAIDPSGTTTLDAWQPDKEGRLLAYQLSEGGNEESVLRVMDVSDGHLVDGPIDRCRYSPVAWLPGGEAFYYVRRIPPDEVPAGEDQYHRRVYLHQVGTSPEQDVMIFGAGMEKTNYYVVAVSRDGHWLTVTASRGTAPRNDVWIADLTSSDPAAPEFVAIQEGLDAQTSARAGRDGRLYLFTDYGAPRGRLAVADPADPGPGSWRDLIGEDPEAVLSNYAILDGPELGKPVLLARWTRHAISEITVHDLATGERTGDVPLPGLGSAGRISERPEGGHEAWFSYTDHTTPTAVHRYDARSGETTLWRSPPGEVQVPAVQTRQMIYASADGTEVRMIVMSPLEADGDAGSRADPGGGAAPGSPAAPRPTVLYGYGGFGVSLTPNVFRVDSCLGRGGRRVRGGRPARWQRRG